jgi:hypothetical protein
LSEAAHANDVPLVFKAVKGFKLVSNMWLQSHCRGRVEMLVLLSLMSCLVCKLHVLQALLAGQLLCQMARWAGVLPTPSVPTCSMLSDCSVVLQVVCVQASVN